MRLDIDQKMRWSHGEKTVALSHLARLALFFALWLATETKEKNHGRTSHRPAFVRPL
jgi:hypothetical protein